MLITVGNCFGQGKTRILILVDGSLSMRNEWIGGTKWNAAINTIGEIADSVGKFRNIEMGLRVFGHLYHEPDKNCRDTRLEVPIDSNTARRIKTKLAEIKPKGITPLVYSMERCVEDFGKAEGKNILVIITDGEDACGGDVCTVAAMLQRNNIVLQPFIIGMSLQPKAYNAMECAGKLINTGSTAEFSTTLKKVVVESVAKTTLQVNLNDTDGKPTETDVNMTFYDVQSGYMKYNFYHALNTRGMPDTITISPMFKYKLQVHTVPPIVIDNVELQKNDHNVINIKAPQGYLNFTLQGVISKTSVVERLKCLVHKTGEQKTISIQSVNTKEKYITGTYDLDILTLPRITLKDVKISQSKTTDIQIPAPGIVTINKTFEAYGGIFINEGGRMQKIYDLKIKEKQETIALQPGKYRMIYRAKNARTIHTTVDKEFEVTSGGTLSLKL